MGRGLDLVTSASIFGSSRVLRPFTSLQDGEWDDEDDEKPSNQRSGEMAFLSDLLGPGGVEDLMADDLDLFNAPEDPELKDDPIWTMDMKVSTVRSSKTTLHEMSFSAVFRALIGCVSLFIFLHLVISLEFSPLAGR